MKVLCKDQFLKGRPSIFNNFVYTFDRFLQMHFKIFDFFHLKSTIYSGVLFTIEIVNKLFFTLDFSLRHLVSPVDMIAWIRSNAISENNSQQQLTV